MSHNWLRASGSAGAKHPIEVAQGLPGETVELRLGPHDRTGWTVPLEEWRAFVAAVRDGEFDDVGRA